MVDVMSLLTRDFELNVVLFRGFGMTKIDVNVSELMSIWTYDSVQELKGSQDSLDSRRHLSLPHKENFDAVVFDVLRVSPENFAVSCFTSAHLKFC